MRDKTGGRCQAWPEARFGAMSDPETATVTDIADKYVTESRISRTITRLEAAGVSKSPTVATVRDRIVSDITREYYTELYRGDEPIVSMEAVESVVAERVQRYVAAEEPYSASCWADRYCKDGGIKLSSGD